MDKIISISHLVKKFGDFTAVDDISFSVRKGERFAFLGPNGAGKTTTIKVLTTLLERTSGDVSISGFDPATQPDEVRRSFGIVFQDQSHDDDLTAYENMEYHGVLYGIEKSVREERIEELLKMVELWDRRDSYLKEFSGGMKRRMEIARGLVHRPKVLFLDEPTLGLDPQTRNRIWAYIHEVAKEQGMTVFFTTHYMEEAERNGDRIAIIDQGQIVAIDSPKGIKEETNAATLEEAFLSLTGKKIRDENPDEFASLKRSKKLGRF